MLLILFVSFFLHVCRSTSKLEIIVSTANKNPLAEYYQELDSKELIEDLWTTCHDQSKQGNFRILDLNTKEIALVCTLSQKKAFTESNDCGMTTLKLGIEALSKMLTSFSADLQCSESTCFQKKAEVLVVLVAFTSSLLYKFTVVEPYLKESNSKVKSLALQLLQFNLLTWMDEKNAGYVPIVQIGFVRNLAIEGSSITRSIELRAIFQALTRSWTCFHASLLAITQSGHVNANTEEQSASSFEINHYFNCFVFAQNTVSRITYRELKLLLDEPPFDYEVALQDVSFLKNASSILKEYFVNLMKKAHMNEVLKLIDRYADDQIEETLAKLIPFEAPEPVVKETKAKPPQKKGNKRKAPVKGRAQVTTTKVVVKTKDEPVLPSRHQQCCVFKVDERDVQYGIILIGNYLKKKYLDLTVVALGFEVGDLSWTSLRQIIQSRLDSQLRFRRGFLLHCINWVQLRNDAAHPVVKVDVSLFADLEAVRSRLGRHTNSIQGVLERLVGPKKPGACKPEPLEKGRPFENPIPTLSAIRLVEAIVNRCFGALFKDLQEEPTLAKLSEIVVDPQDVGLSPSEFEAIKALWSYRNTLSHEVKSVNVTTCYVSNLFHGHASFEPFLSHIFRK